MSRIDDLANAVQAVLGDRLQRVEVILGELVVTLAPESYLEGCRLLRDAPECQFEELLDLCGVDYLTYGEGVHEGARFQVVSQLLSVTLNQRIRVKVWCPDDDLPRVSSLMALWPSVNWFEREAFDLYGIVFEGHPDLRRILTDYGFIGHPFRKDFPVSGHVEMIYDDDQKRVIYQPVTIEPREIVPRVIREEEYGHLKH